MDGNDVRVAMYRSFVETGRPPMPVEIAAELGAPLADVERRNTSSITASPQRWYEDVGHT
jgi:hypothetical protein